MNAIDLRNGVAAAVALGSSLAAAHATSSSSPAAGLGTPPFLSSSSPGETRPRYVRIASASTVADPLLRDLCPADRVISVSAATRNGPQGHRYAGKATITSLEDLETIIALDPDLLVVSNLGFPRRVARLEDAGIPVLDLGPPTGWSSLRGDAEQLGDVCASSAAAAAWVTSFGSRLERVADDAAPRRRGLYLAVYGGRLYGGTTGSSYHDVLRFAGFDDAAAGRFEGFPAFTAEEVLALQPDVVVTKTGMAAELCGDDALSRLAACRAGAVVEIEADVLDDPGVGMLEAAERLARATR
ncbi:MAG: ABC transporter substrate-binding protein [Myxococcota bacterium]